MYFPLSFAAGIFVFACGIFAAGIFYFIYNSVNKIKISSCKISFFIFSISLIILPVVFFIVYVPGEIARDVFKLSVSQIIFCVVLFVLGISFFYFTKVTAISLALVYVICTIAVFVSLSVSYDRKKNYDITLKSAGEMHEVYLECVELKPFVFLALPRIWYKMSGNEKPRKNSLVEFILKNSVRQSKTLTLELPEQKYYPAVFRINIRTTGTNVFAKVNSVY